MELFEKTIIGFAAVNSQTHNVFIVNKNSIYFKEWTDLKWKIYKSEMMAKKDVNDWVCYNCGKVFKNYIHALDHAHIIDDN